MGLLQRLFKRNKPAATKNDPAVIKAPEAKAAAKAAAAAPATQCTATTKAGTQCKRSAGEGSAFCATHKN